MAFIYLMSSGRDLIKVGIAKDVGRRRRALQTGQPFDMQVLHRIEVADDAALGIEKAIHKRLKRFHIRGEWFRVARIARSQGRMLMMLRWQSFAAEHAATKARLRLRLFTD